MKIKMLKDIKTHKKLNLFKCQKFYRTNFDLLIILKILTIAILATQSTSILWCVDCSELNSIIDSSYFERLILLSANSSNSSNSSNNSNNNNSIFYNNSNNSSSENLISVTDIKSSDKKTNKLINNIQIDQLSNIFASSISQSSATLSMQQHSTTINTVQEEQKHQHHLSESTFFDKRKSPTSKSQQAMAATSDTILAIVTPNQLSSFGKISDQDINKLQKIVMKGLGLQMLPDVSKTNISQEEYTTKYNEYLERVRERKKRELLEYSNMDFIEEIAYPKKLFTYQHNSSDIGSYFPNNSYNYDKNSTSRRHYDRRRRRRKRSIIDHKDSNNKHNNHNHSNNSKNIIYVRFPIKNDNYIPTDVEEAILRLLVIFDQNHSTNSQQKTIHISSGNTYSNKRDINKMDDNVIEIKVYQLTEPYGRIWLGSRKIYLGTNDHHQEMSAAVVAEHSDSHWVEFDVRKAVDGWLTGRHSNLGLEIQCDLCEKNGAYIVNDSTTNNPNSEHVPVLNIVGRLHQREKRSKQQHYNHLMSSSRRKPRKTDCFAENHRCCRHQMEVIFKEIKGFEFIIQPKVFDAGYCKGKCPPRYNPAHHHAVLQSLIWKQDKSKAPRPCCAPSKLVELEVLHVDEKDSRKLRVSTWADMRVLECACS